MLRHSRALRKFSGGPWLSKKRDLLAPRRQERQVRKFNFFAAFAPLREIFRVLVAAPRAGFLGRSHLTCCSGMLTRLRLEGAEERHQILFFRRRQFLVDVRAKSVPSDGGSFCSVA